MLGDRPGPVWDLAVSPDGHWLASGGVGHSALLWDLTRIHPLAQQLLPQDLDIYQPILNSLSFEPFVTDLAFSPDGKILAIAYFDGSIILWGRATG